ncbi:DUF4198 domain-containing protein [Paenibacillus sp. GSMTC-2017]|uniref:DUF4198 domain-containing protein n=1 Tax=Paenibacillus sp. GSMTC-2017 TaxID=2794350 RepID=UPI0018D5E592|nr:DUF4198 domain-containing protein [Paenibacillus sp. GSMTC-2017]MBH5319100.1 DUF4198 domain-containing protein [Paenibacillus sp. GSMTC-2017]
MKIRKKVIGVALAAVLTIGAAVPVFAHDGWSQANSPIIAPGQVSYVELMLGNHSNEHKSYRIAGQWSADTSKVYVTTPAGVKSDITSTRFYTGEAATEAEPALNNYFVASFKSNAPGAYIISVEGDSVFKREGVGSRTLRSAKSFVAVGDIPVLERVKALKGFAKEVSPDRAELIPHTNPAAITTGQEVSIQLLLKGKPLADTAVDVIRRSNSEATQLKTDANGFVTLKAGAADYYLVRAKPGTTEAKAGEYDKTSYEATLTFTVQNESPKLPGKAAAGVPHIYVNGNVISADAGVSIEKGTTKVTADFVRKYITADYKGDDLSTLRTVAEANGATVEYFPAVGDNRAAVAIYTK